MPIHLSFLGAAGCVTGSAYLIQTSRAQILIDFGLFQGMGDKEDLNQMPPSLDVSKLNAVLLTHAHLDHTGRLPLLSRHGYTGPIYCTTTTIALCGLILRDSAHLQMMDVERANRKRERSGAPLLEPIYTAEHVAQVFDLLQGVEYDITREVAPGIRARWVEAGHMLGSASIQLCIEEDGDTKAVVFSGDIGAKGAPILKDAVGFKSADVVVMESTYGDRDHKPLQETVEEFEEIIRDTVARRGKILVPVFAVGRTQLLLYLLAQLFRRKVVPKFPIYLDSPMATEATKIYWEHLKLFDEDFQALHLERPLAEDLSMLESTPTAEDSKALNDKPGPCLIMAGSGMCTGGRILHHLRHNLGKPEASILIVGFQSEGSLGRRIVDGDKEIVMFGERIQVKARIHTLGGFSAHAGKTDLLGWLSPIAKDKPRLFLTHGESRGREPLAQYVRKQFGLNAELPVLGQRVQL